jgi:hypothetical protein
MPSEEIGPKTGAAHEATPPILVLDPVVKPKTPLFKPAPSPFDSKKEDMPVEEILDLNFEDIPFEEEEGGDEDTAAAPASEKEEEMGIEFEEL